jgi:hypothetical protein
MRIVALIQFIAVVGDVLPNEMAQVYYEAVSRALAGVPATVCSHFINGDGVHSVLYKDGDGNYKKLKSQTVDSSSQVEFVDDGVPEDLMDVNRLSCKSSNWEISSQLYRRPLDVTPHSVKLSPPGCVSFTLIPREYGGFRSGIGEIESLMSSNPIPCLFRGSATTQGRYHYCRLSPEKTPFASYDAEVEIPSLCLMIQEFVLQHSSVLGKYMQISLPEEKMHRGPADAVRTVGAIAEVKVEDPRETIEFSYTYEERTGTLVITLKKSSISENARGYVEKIIDIEGGHFKCLHSFWKFEGTFTISEPDWAQLLEKMGPIGDETLRKAICNEAYMKVVYRTRN